MDSTWWWVLAIALIAIGTVGTVLPVIPGAAVVFAGMLLAAWIDDFQRVGWITLTVLGVLTALTFVFDIIGALIGAKRVGASRLALAGAAIGTLVGLFFGFLGILIAPFVGAVIGELISRRQLGAAARVGLGTWIGLAVGTLAKIGLVFAMLAVFVTSYLIDSKVQAAPSTMERTQASPRQHERIPQIRRTVPLCRTGSSTLVAESRSAATARPISLPEAPPGVLRLLLVRRDDCQGLRLVVLQFDFVCCPVAYQDLAATRTLLVLSPKLELHAAKWTLAPAFGSQLQDNPDGTSPATS